MLRAEGKLLTVFILDYIFILMCGDCNNEFGSFTFSFSLCNMLELEQFLDGFYRLLGTTYQKYSVARIIRTLKLLFEFFFARTGVFKEILK